MGLWDTEPDNKSKPAAECLKCGHVTTGMWAQHFMRGGSALQILQIYKPP